MSEVESKNRSADTPATQETGSASSTQPTTSSATIAQPHDSSQMPPAHSRRIGWILAAGLLALIVVGYLLVPRIYTALNTVSTDDAYVNGHVTFVAARVAGQVMKVLVDDNYRVKKGALLVQLDKEPYQVIV